MEVSKVIKKLNGSAMVVRGDTGIVIAMLTSVNNQNPTESDCKIFQISENIGVITNGPKNHSKAAIEHIQETFVNSVAANGPPVTAKALAESLGLLFSYRDQNTSIQGFAVEVVIFSCTSSSSPEIFCVNSKGECFGYFGCAVGKFKNELIEEIKALDFPFSMVERLLFFSAQCMIKMLRLEKETTAAPENFSHYLMIFCVGSITNGKFERLRDEAFKAVMKVGRLMMISSEADEGNKSFSHQ